MALAFAGGVARPFGGEQRVEVVVVDGLLVVAADGVEQLDQRAGEDVRGLRHQLVAGGVHRGVVGFGLAGGGAGGGLDPVAVDGVEEVAHDVRQRLAGGVLDARLLLGAELLVEPGEAGGERGDAVVVADAHHHAHGEVAEGDGGLGVERAARRSSATW